jgi:hypothetical protein
MNFPMADGVLKLRLFPVNFHEQLIFEMFELLKKFFQSVVHGSIWHRNPGQSPIKERGRPRPRIPNPHGNRTKRQKLSAHNFGLLSSQKNEKQIHVGYFLNSILI